MYIYVELRDKPQPVCVLSEYKTPVAIPVRLFAVAAEVTLYCLRYKNILSFIEHIERYVLCKQNILK